MGELPPQLLGFYFFVQSPSQTVGRPSDVLLGAAGGSRAGARGVLGDLLLPRTGGRQHGSAQNVQEGPAPRDEDGGAKLKPANRYFIIYDVVS